MIRIFRTLSMAVLAAGGVLAAEWPYAVCPQGGAVSYPLAVDGASLGTAALSWTQQALVVEVDVQDATPVGLKDVGVGIDQAYLADSVEFWVGRHQFVAAHTPEGGRLWDYLYAHGVPDADVTHEFLGDGYRMRIAVRWKILGLEPREGLCFPFALQLNDRQRTRDGERWKDSGRQLLFPAGATWDRPSTYGVVYLTGNAPAMAPAAPAPLPFAALEIRQYAYARQVEALVRRLDPFLHARLRLVCRQPSGAIVADLPVPIDREPPASQDLGSAMLLSLPWDETQAGIFQAELYLEHQGRRYGPVAEPYFTGGPAPIAEYRSDRRAPDDLGEFWEGKLAAMRARPLHADVKEAPSERPGVVVEKVTLDNHRGHPMTVWVTHRREEGGRRPAHLNVYPPMRAAAPVWPREGYLGITFCGSRQGECRLPGQDADEGLWARAESPDESYWLDVVLDGVRAMDYVAGRTDSSGKTIVSGGSRGGWYALALAAVAPERVALARFTSPCYSDVTMNRQLGFGSAATEIYTTFERDRVKTGGRVFDTFRYFDPLFLAERVRTPVVFSAGLQDNICSAIGMTAAAHRMPAEFCTFVLDAEGGHGGSPWMQSINRAAEKRAMRQGETQP